MRWPRDTARKRGRRLRHHSARPETPQPLPEGGQLFYQALGLGAAGGAARPLALGRILGALHLHAQPLHRREVELGRVGPRAQDELVDAGFLGRKVVLEGRCGKLENALRTLDAILGLVWFGLGFVFIIWVFK